MSLKTNNNRSAINRLIFDYLSNYKLTIALALIMMIVSAAATGLHAWLVRPALDEVLIKGNKEMLLLIPIAIIIVTLSKGIATYIHSYQMSKTFSFIAGDLKGEITTQDCNFRGLFSPPEDWPNPYLFDGIMKNELCKKYQEGGIMQEES